MSHEAENLAVLYSQWGLTEFAWYFRTVDQKCQTEIKFSTTGL